MKKSSIVTMSIIILIMISTIILMVIFASEEKDQIDTYSKIEIGNYTFELNDKYQYKYLEDKKYGIFENEIFLTSYLYISETKYSNLISQSSYYTNMGSDEIDTSIEEMNFGDYQGFINIKRVNYNDVNQDYNLVIILIKLNDEETLVLQYEISLEEDVNDILSDIKNSLSNVKKKD